jgi:hypothetical protein
MNIKVGSKLKAIREVTFRKCITLNKIYTISEIKRNSFGDIVYVYFNCDKVTDQTISKHPAYLNDIIGENAYLQIIVLNLNPKIKIL